MGILADSHYLDQLGQRFDYSLNELAEKLYNFKTGKNTKLFHYTSSKSLENILKENELWFSDSTCLNDKSEGSYYIELFYDYFKNFNNGESEFSRFKEEVLDSIHLENETFFHAKNFSKTAERMKYFICSLSLDDDSLPMWNYYTKNHDKIGYNLCFNKSNIVNSIKESLKQKKIKYYNVESIKVLYDKNKQNNFLKECILLTYGKWKEANIYGMFVIADLVELLIRLKFIFKHPSFKSEKEVKLVISISEDDFNKQINKKILKIRTQNNEIVPYLSLAFDNSLKEIKASPLTPNYMSVEYLLKYYGYKNVKIEKSEIPLR